MAAEKGNGAAACLIYSQPPPKGSVSCNILSIEQHNIPRPHSAFSKLSPCLNLRPKFLARCGWPSVSPQRKIVPPPEKMELGHQTTEVGHRKMDVRHEKMDAPHQKTEVGHQAMDVRHQKMEMGHSKMNVPHEKMELGHRIRAKPSSSRPKPSYRWVLLYDNVRNKTSPRGAVRTCSSKSSQYPPIPMILLTRPQRACGAS